MARIPSTGRGITGHKTLVEGRGLLFEAKLASGESAVSAATDRGVWAADSQGVLRLVLREGDLINGKSLRSFKLLQAVARSPAQRRTWTTADPTATLISLASFSDGSTAILTTSIP